MQITAELIHVKAHNTIQTVFVRRKIEQELNVKETKPPIVTQQMNVLFKAFNVTCVMQVM